MGLTRFRFLIVPLFFVFACVAAMAQQNSEITGTVTDQTGAAVPGAKLVLTQTETGFVYNGESNSTGGFVFAGLNVGVYTLRATAKGFEGYTATGLTLNVSQTLAADIKLTVGAESVEVSVTADALQVQAESNDVSTLISGQQMTEIASENRNFTSLAALGLGVSSNLPDNNAPTSTTSNFSISVNGLRQSHNIWLIDGGESDDRGNGGTMAVQPSVDAVAQFQVLASNYPPDYGIASGATMSLALKSGTQKFHGTLWEFLRNDALDANNFFNKYNGANNPIPELRQNIFGANLGGPVFIPHVYNTTKQKTFFFYNEEWRRIVAGAQPTIANTIPDADRPQPGVDLTYTPPKFSVNADRPNGLILYAPSVAADTTLGKAEIATGITPGQVLTTVPYQLFDANAMLYFNAAKPVVPKEGNASGQSVTSETSPTNVREDLVRIDHKFSDKWQILGHYIHDATVQSDPNATLGWNYESYATVISTVSNPSNSAAIKISGEISPNLLVEAGFNYDGNVLTITNSQNAMQPTGWSVNKIFDNGSKALPGGQWDGAYGTGEQMGYAPWHNAAQDYDPRVDISYTQGKHAMKFGFGYNRYTKNQQLQIDPGGDYQFSRNVTDNLAVDPVDKNGNTIQMGDAFMSQVFGLASQYTEAQAIPTLHWVNQTTSVYAFDNWHVTPRLSLQLGLRYDALPHAYERNNQVANFVPSLYSTGSLPDWNSDNSILRTGPGVATVLGGTQPFYTNGMQLTGQNGFPRGMVTNDYNTLQPRVGFSEDLLGNGKTILRGGFGIFYERLQGNDSYGAGTNVPFAYNPTLSTVEFSDPHTSYQTGIALSSTQLPVLAAGITSLAVGNYKAPGVAEYSLGVQREITPSVIWVVQYVGNLAWHQNVDRNINTFPLTTSNALRSAYVNGTINSATGPQVPGAANGLRTYPGFAGINQEENSTNGSYSGFQTGLRVQNKWGLSGELDYTWSHELDLTSTDLQTVSNPWNLRYDRGAGQFDRRNIVTANYIYKLPIFTKSTGLLRTTLGGWEIAGTFVDESGVPVVAATNAADTVGLGGGYTARPNIIGKMHYHKGSITNYFDTSVFSNATPGYEGGPNLGFGNARRDTIVGPGRVNFTTSLYKSFAFGERAHFEFRAESFNTFNHSEFGSASTGDGVDATLGDGRFGQITSTWDPRVLEIGGKFIF